MKNFTFLFARLALALTLTTGAGAAMAVPTSYHVTINTAKFAAGDGILEMTLLGYATSGAATAIVSNFTGGTGPSIVDVTTSGDLSTSATLTGSGYNYVDQLVTFGGLINFDVLFDFAATGDATTFALQFYDTAFTTYIGVDGPFSTFLLNPGAGIDVANNAGFITVSENAAAVPEPGQWILMLSGLLLMGAMVRRRNM